MKSFAGIALALLIACSGSATPPAAGPAPGRNAAPELTPRERLDAARAHFLASDYAAAEAAFRQVSSGSTQAAAELGLSEVTLMSGRYEDAIGFARAAFARDPSLAARAVTIAARALQQSGKLAEAEAELLPFERDVSARSARLLLGEVFLETGRRSRAEPILLGLVEDYNADRITEDDSEGLALAARAAWLLRSPRDANTLFNAAERALSTDPRLLLWRAELFLDKYDPGHAEEVLAEILRKAPRHPEALTWMAHVRLDQALDFDEAERLARLALKQNPKLTSAYFVLAGIALRDMELERADQLIDEGLRGNPRDLTLLSLRATVRFLGDDKGGFEQAKRAVLTLNPEYTELYSILGEYADWEHRYDEIVEFMQEALTVDSEDAHALAQLGFNLIRAGREQEGVQALSRAFSLDPYNVRVYNTLNLFDTIIPKAYVSVRHPRFLIRYHKDDKELLERYVPDLLNRAFDAMREDYGFTPELPIGVEIYAERQSFAVRTSGLPRTAIQGVCFGKTLASMSPQNESFNLGMTLWHELSHVFHIQLSKSRVPRWFTEGLAEYETLVTRPEWAREHDSELYDMVRSGKLPALGNMSRAFTRAEELGDVATAYYASSRIVEMLARSHGRPKMAEMLRLWGEGRQTPQVFSEALGQDLATVDRKIKSEIDATLTRYGKQFVPLKRARARGALEDLLKSSPADPSLKVELALSLLRGGKPKTSAKLADEALKLDPKNAQARFLRAQIHAQAGERELAERLLRRMVLDGQDGYSVDLQLAELARARGDSASARAALELAHRKDPTQVEPLIALAEIARGENVADEELTILEKLAQLSEHSAVTHRRLLERLIEEKRFADAVRAGEAALWADIAGLWTHVLFAEALASTGDLERARFELESALLCRGEPSQLAEAHARLAELLVRMKQRGAAKKNADEARRLDPTNPRLQGLRL